VILLGIESAPLLEDEEEDDIMGIRRNLPLAQRDRLVTATTSYITGYYTQTQR